MEPKNKKVLRNFSISYLVIVLFIIIPIAMRVSDSVSKVNTIVFSAAIFSFVFANSYIILKRKLTETDFDKSHYKILVNNTVLRLLIGPIGALAVYLTLIVHSIFVGTLLTIIFFGYFSLRIYFAYTIGRHPKK